MIKKREVFLVKIEGTYNVDPTPVAATDAVMVEEPGLANEGLRMSERPRVSDSLAPIQSIYGDRLMTVTFTAELKGSGTAGTPPEIDALLRSCGYAVTNVPATSDTYKPASSGHESCTIYAYQDGKRTILTGCRGTFTLKAEAGMPSRLQFTMTGHVSVPTDTALVTPTYDSTVPVAFKSAGFSIDGYSAIIAALNLDAGNQMATPPDCNASDGFGEIQIVSRAITGSFDPEDTLVATEDWWGNFVAGTNMALTTGVIGSTAGNRYQISCPAVYYSNLSQGDRDGIRTLEAPFAAVESSGNDELSLAFT